MSQFNQQMKRADTETFAAEDEIDLGEYLGALIEGKWLILAVTLCLGSLAGIYAFFATPIYTANALLQVEEKTNGVGFSDDLMGLMSSSNGGAETEIEILRSRSVLFKVIEEVNLNISVIPKTFPYIGDYFLRSYKGEGFREPIMGLGSYAWGGESLRIETMNIPDSLLGTQLIIVAHGKQQYGLYHDGVLILNGVVGTYAHNDTLGVGIYLSILQAKEGTEFRVVKHRLAVIYAQTLQRLTVTERGKGTGILALSYNDSDPQKTKDFLDVLAKSYLRQNVERKTEVANRSLLFIQEQLPLVQQQLQVAETLVNEYRLKTGSVDLNIETQSVLNKIVGIDKQISELEMEKADLSQRFTEAHPMMQVLKSKKVRLEDEKIKIEQKLMLLPKIEQEMVTMMRNVKVNSELYTFLLNKSQELKVAEAGTVGNVRILDFALKPYSSGKPNKRLISMIGFILGLFAGVLIVFVRKALNQGVEDPDLIERLTGLSVFAAVPHSELQNKLHTKMRKAKGQGVDSLLAKVDNTDLSIESLRSLRTNLHFSLMEAKGNIVMLTGPSPGLGKSFISANFGAVLAGSGQRILLIDGDMRKGHLHEYFQIGREKGLSGLISGTVTIEEAIKKTVIDGLYVLPTGVLPPNPADLLMSANFDKILDNLSEAYDLILIDTPPVLAVTDALLIGRRASVSFMLLRSGSHPKREIQQAIKYVENAGVSLAGFIFNDILPKASGYKYGAYHYQYDYKSGEK